MAPYQDFNRSDPGPYNSLLMHSSGQWQYFDETTSQWTDAPFSKLSMPNVPLLHNPAAGAADVMLWCWGFWAAGCIALVGIWFLVHALRKGKRGDGTPDTLSPMSLRDLLGRLRRKRKVSGEEEGRKIRMEGLGSPKY